MEMAWARARATGRAAVEWVGEEACRALEMMVVLICGSQSILIAIGESISSRGVQTIGRSESRKTELRHMATWEGGALNY